MDGSPVGSWGAQWGPGDLCEPSSVRCGTPDHPAPAVYIPSPKCDRKEEI